MQFLLPPLPVPPRPCVSPFEDDRGVGPPGRPPTPPEGRSLIDSFPLPLLLLPPSLDVVGVFAPSLPPSLSVLPGRPLPQGGGSSPLDGGEGEGLSHRARAVRLRPSLSPPPVRTTGMRQTHSSTPHTHTHTHTHAPHMPPHISRSHHTIPPHPITVLRTRVCVELLHSPLSLCVTACAVVVSTGGVVGC